ncbi:MAG: prepilin-type N-terminal cleavage/methylation domain-containing protein [Epsilonproteobacteria bacterium]|nr:prepilin-type N-terminal cleavage/methylation domain-containing protein [Campylobacterota bacterium]
MKKHGAFSLIEVIFVLVILGVIASISSQIIAQVYENYITQRAVYNVSTKTELIANQIVNRLSYRIQGSTISKNHNTFKTTSGTNWADDDDWLPIKDVPNGGEEYTTIEWIGYDYDSFAAYSTPSWSGVANYESNNTNREQFETPGSSLNQATTIINNLSNGEVNLVDKPAAVIFGHRNNHYTGSNEYNPLCMGLIPQDPSSSTDCIFPVIRSGNKILKFSRLNQSKIITERYKLAWSAYAIAPEVREDSAGNTITGSDNEPLYDLVLYSNYQPWNGENYIDDGTRNILMTNVSVFKFSENGGVIQFKLCAQEDIGQREKDPLTGNEIPINISTCKEKAVIR